jgi:ethanolamine utilization cobalamin adenosyltransferase
LSGNKAGYLKVKSHEVACMGDVITLIEMKKFSGMEKAVFSAGTILTPSAKDWAKENKIEIIYGETAEQKENSKDIDLQSRDKFELLKHLLKAVIGNMEKAGGFLKKEELVEVVTRCLEKMGNKVER